MSFPREVKPLFVYGSLMEGFQNYDRELDALIERRTLARVHGEVWHQTKKGYPALIPGEGWVRGELLIIPQLLTQLDRLDVIEAYLGPDEPGNEYERLSVPVYPLDGGEPVEAYVYFYARFDLDTAENPAVLLEDGDWRAYMTSGR